MKKIIYLLALISLTIFAVANDSIVSDSVVKTDVTTTVTETESSSVISYFLNGLELNYFIALFLFALLGALLNLLFDISERDKSSTRTPESFNFKFMLKDNIVRFAISVLLIYFGIIFSEAIFGVAITIQLAVCLGFSLDAVAVIIKNKFKVKPTA